MNRFDRSSVLLGVAAFVGPLALYIATMRPDIDFWDTGEMQTVPWILGIAHPTGFPAFVLGGFAFTHLVPIGSIAWRMTLFSATAMALAAWALFAAARELRLAPASALLASWTFATSALVWSRGTRTEVHALAVATIAIALWIGFRFLRTRDLRLLPYGALALSISLGVHPVAVFIVPLMAIWTLCGIRARRRMTAARRPAMPKRGALIAACLTTACFGPLLYCYMPLRSAWVTKLAIDPTLSLGLPPGRPYWDYGHTADWSGFIAELTGSAFTVSGGFSGIFSPAVYAKLPAVFFADLNSALGHHAVVLCIVIGVFVTRKRIGNAACIALLVFGFLAVPFAASYTSESDVPRYFLAAYWIATLFMVGGLEAIARFITYCCALIMPRLKNAWYYVRFALPVLALAFAVNTNIVENRPQMVLQHRDVGARNFINRILHDTPQNAIIISLWTYATPLAYAAYVEGSMQQRIVETAWPGDDAAYFRSWMAQRPIILVSPDGRVPANVAEAKPLDTGYPQLLLVTKLQ